MKRWTISQGGLACVLAVGLATGLPVRAAAAGAPAAVSPVAQTRSLPRTLAFGSVAFSAAPSQAAQSGAPVARYRIDNYSLTLDLSGSQPLLRFSNSTEIFALRAQRGPRGDTIYTNDAGEMMLKATGLGGLTAFTLDQPQGVPGVYLGGGSSLGLPDVRNGVELVKRLRQASARISQDSGHAVDLISDDLSGPEVLPLVWDTATVAVEAFDQAVSGANAKKKSVIASLAVVRIIEGRPPSAHVDKDTLTLVITPEMGLAGRPSSFRILKVLFK